MNDLHTKFIGKRILLYSLKAYFHLATLHLDNSPNYANIELQLLKRIQVYFGKKVTIYEGR